MTVYAVPDMKAYPMARAKTSPPRGTASVGSRADRSVAPGSARRRDRQPKARILVG